MVGNASKIPPGIQSDWGQIIPTDDEVTFDTNFRRSVEIKKRRMADKTTEYSQQPTTTQPSVGNRRTSYGNILGSRKLIKPPRLDECIQTGGEKVQVVDLHSIKEGQVDKFVDTSAML